MQLRLHGYGCYKRHTLILCIRCVPRETLVQITLDYGGCQLHKNARRAFYISTKANTNRGAALGGETCVLENFAPRVKQILIAETERN